MGYKIVILVIAIVSVLFTSGINLDAFAVFDPPPLTFIEIIDDAKFKNCFQDIWTQEQCDSTSSSNRERSWDLFPRQNWDETDGFDDVKHVDLFGDFGARGNYGAEGTVLSFGKASNLEGTAQVS